MISSITFVPLWTLLFCFIWFDRLSELRADFFATNYFATPWRKDSVLAPQSKIKNFLEYLKLGYPEVRSRTKYLANPGAYEYGIVSIIAISGLSLFIYVVYAEIVVLTKDAMFEGDAVYKLFNYPFAFIFCVYLARQSRIIPLTLERFVTAVAYYFTLTALFPLVNYLNYANFWDAVAATSLELLIERIKTQLKYGLSFLLIASLLVFTFCGLPTLTRKS